MAEARETKITDYTFDPANANAGTVRGLKALEYSLSTLGAGRSIVVDKNRNVIAGNKTLQEWADLGFTDLVEIDVSGDTLVVVRRGDLDLLSEADARARKLAYADNRVGELDLSWQAEQLLADSVAMPGLFASPLFAPEELVALTQGNVQGWNPEEDTRESPDGDGIDTLVGYNLSSFWKDLPRTCEFSQYHLELPPRMGVEGSMWNQYSRANADETRRIVTTYMRPGDRFYEMCCGWVTYSSVAKYYGYSGVASDIWDVSLDFCKRQLQAMPGTGKVEVKERDCRDTQEPEASFNYLYCNPPFFSLEPYGGADNDLAAQGTYERWLDAMADMAREAGRILKPGSLATFVINDYREHGYLRLMHVDFANALTRTSGLQPWDFVVAEVQSQRMRLRKQEYERRRTVKGHEYVITLKKPE